MLSSPEIVESYNRLSVALRELLGTQELELQIVSDGDYPLLILKTGSDLAGFAVLDGSPEPAYYKAYDAFKVLYRKNHDSWKDRNLSFVVCRSEPKAAHDAFFSKTETDIYFCRKYVILLYRKEDEQERELLRLPFLPLREDGVHGVIRPPSAQTLLRSLDLSAELATQIVVDRKRSAERIVDDLLTGKVALPPVLAGDHRVQPEVFHQAPAAEPTRVLSIEIEAFRAYRRRQEFDLDADVVVLYGPNGLGKTSFFDALDYVCTGRIGRLCRHRVSVERFTGFARHLDSSAAEGSVCLKVRRGTTSSSIRRKVAERNYALIAGKKHDRAGVLQFLTSARWGERKAHIANLERLFRATHLFSQSTPQLLLQFEEDSTIPFDLVSRMLALDDYASGLAKVEAVRDLLNRQDSETVRERSGLTNRIDQVQSRIRELPGLQTGVHAGDQIHEEARKLLEELEEHAALTIDKTGPTAESVREWRAMVEAAVKGAQDSLRRLHAVESRFPQFKKDRSALEHARAEYLCVATALKEKAAEQEQNQEERAQLMDRLERNRGVLAQTESKLRALSEFGDLREVYEKAYGSLLSWRQELKHVAGKTEAIGDELRPLLADAESLRARVAKQQEESQVHSLQMQGVSVIQDELPAWHKNKEHTANLQRTAEEVDSTILAINGQVASLEVAIAGKEKVLTACKQEYGRLAADRLELTGLLDEIEAHVSDGICPACGTDHDSKTTLIKRIHAQKQARPAHVEELANQRGDLQKTLKEDRASLAALTNERTSKTSELDETRDELSRFRASVTAFEQKVAEAGWSIGEELADTLARQLAIERKAYEFARAAQKKFESELNDAVKRISALKRRSEEQVSARECGGVAITRLENQITALRTRADKLGLSLETEPDDLDSETDAVASREAEAKQDITDLTRKLEALTRAVDQKDAQLQEIRNRVKALVPEIERLESELDRYTEYAATVLDRKRISRNAISERKKLSEERVDRLQTLERRCLTLERSLDAVQRSAMLADLEIQAQSLAREMRSLDESAERISTARKLFASVKDALDGQSSRAVANYVNALGPLTTLIQKRLRVVYGFGDVSLRAKGNEIRIVVGWEDLDVKPGDYFSDSQKQILMLSLFLAGRLTQTWSGFAPILIDDPATHFDDLNAFGFVELMRGLAAAYPGQRQFFVSTSDDRLFELMRSKFSGLNGGARFYAFEGISRDGPAVKQLE